jgi:aminoglycoside 6'-N-acetyltransferase
VSAPTPIIEGRRTRLILLDATHADALRAIHRRPEVVAWWGEPDPAFPLDDDPDSVRYVVMLRDDEEAIPRGLVQYAEEDDPMYRHAGIDVFLDPEIHGHGYGREVVGTLAAHLIDVCGHHRLSIDPAAGNTAAIACYAAIGFRPVGVMRRYERGHDGTFHDGLLMDLLADELVRL